MTDLYDITIIGGGPAGLFAGFYAGMRQAKTKIIESLGILGGQPANLYPEKTIHDIAGFSAITGQDLTDRLIEQLDPFQPTICLNEEVVQFNQEADGHFTIQTNQGSHQSKTIIIALGGGAFQPRRLDLDGADQYESTNLHYLVGPLEDYRDKKVLINGGGDSALDWALALNQVASQVSLCHRRDKFRAHEHSVNQVLNSDIEVLTPYEPVKLEGNGNQLEAMVLQKRRSDEEIRVEADVFIISYGMQASLGALSTWPILSTRNKVLVNEKMETSLKGVYAIGDIANHPGKIDLIATGFGEAPVAVSHAINYIYPDQQVQPEQSTSLSLNEGV